VPGMALERSHSEARGDREKSSAMMLAEIKENEGEIQKNRSTMANRIRDHFQHYFSPENLAPNSDAKPRIENNEPEPRRPGSLQQLAADLLRLQQQVNSQLTAIKHLQRKNSGLLVEVHKKYSIPVACLIFVLIGAPLGILARRGSLVMAGGISFAFFLLFWASLIGGEELADKQLISPFAAMWTANILVGIAGVFMVFYSIYGVVPLKPTIGKKRILSWFRRGRS